MQEIALAAIVGFFIGWVLRSLLEPPKPRDPFENRAKIQLGSSTWILRDIDSDRLLALAARFAAGRKLTFETMTGAHRIFTADEWRRVRKELIKANIFVTNRRGELLPTPQGRQILENMAGKMNEGKRTNEHSRGVELKWR